MSANQEELKACTAHSNNPFEIFCTTCKTSACKDCKQILTCYQNKHDVIPMTTAIQRFNQNAIEAIKIAESIKNKLEETFDSIFENKSNFESHLKLCRTAIDIQEKAIIEMVQEKSNALKNELESLQSIKEKDIEREVNDLDVFQGQVKTLITSVNKIMDNPKENEALESYKTSIIAVRDKVTGAGIGESLNKTSIPVYILSSNVSELVSREGIGEIISVNDRYKVASGDESITVTKGQIFVIKVSSQVGDDSGEMTASLRHSLGEESCDLEHQGSGEYNIKCRCTVEGDWKLEVTVGDVHIKGSPVNIKVEKPGLVHTIDNLSDFYKEYDKEVGVTDVLLDKDGYLLIANKSREILRFDERYSQVDTIHCPENVRVNRMHRMTCGSIVYSNNVGVGIMCCDTYKEIRSFGEEVLKKPLGLTVNEETRMLYVADGQAHCVFKFNIDDGKLLGSIGSEGKKDGQMKTPFDVVVTKKGNLVVCCLDNNRVQMFDSQDRFMRRLVGYGNDDGKVVGPYGLTMDTDDHLIVSSSLKLQLFDSSGDFIKRINCQDDELKVPCGIAVISNRPRRVAVANHLSNNVKIFNY